MVPEISHRCSSCGASIRDGDALFCPECGKPLAEGEIRPKENDQPALAEAESSDKTAAAETPPSEPTVDAPPPKADAEAADHPHRIGDKTRETLHRASAAASAAARGVIEEPAKQVEKIRHASTHVIEEASYDPSLRFVLVALGLFVVFIILLVLSKVMG